MHETSGVLRPAVEAYLRGQVLTLRQVAAMRAYCRQWIGAAAWDQNPDAGDQERAELADLRRDVDGITTEAALDRWLERVTDFGADPL